MSKPLAFNLQTAFDHFHPILSRWFSETFTEQYTEGPTVLKLGDEWIIYFDRYRTNRYGAVRTRDFKTFTDITDKVSFPKNQRHGTVFRASYEILEGLKRHKQASGDSP